MNGHRPGKQKNGNRNTVRLGGTALLFVVLCAGATTVFATGENISEDQSGKTPIVITRVIHGPLTDAAELILAEAYRRLGLTVEFRDVPGERALIMTNKGETDAEMFRVDGMRKTYPNLIKIPVPYVTSYNVVFGKKVDFKVDGWESLRPYTIALRIGLKQGEAGTEGMNRYLTDSTKEAFMMLDSGRAQIVFEGRLNGLEYIRRLNLKGIKALEPPLTTNPLYHYLHKKHENLARQLTEVFKKMKNEGSFQRVYDTVVEKLVNNSDAEKKEDG